MHPFPSLLCALAPFLPTQEVTGSLERFLHEARAEQAAELKALAPQLSPLLARLATKKGFSSSRLRVREEILAMGNAVAPLLVQSLKIPAEAELDAAHLATEVKDLLVELKPGGINRALFQLANSASTRTRQHAIEVLGHVSNPVGVSAFLVRIYRKGEPELRVGCIAALAQRGGRDNLSLLREALGDSDPEIRSHVLQALAAAADASAADAVLDAITSPAAAVSMARQVVAYYRAVPQMVDSKVVRALGRLAIEVSADNDACLALLGALPRFPASRKSRELRQIIDPIKQSAQPDVRDGALVCLYLIGDRKAKKDLLQPYNKSIKQDPRFPQGYSDRGEVQLQLEEYNDAIRDFKQALDLISSNRSRAFKNNMINLARAQALSGKLARAQETLRSAGLNPSDVKKLRLDPSFKELKASTRYGKVLR